MAEQPDRQEGGDGTSEAVKDGFSLAATWGPSEEEAQLQDMEGAPEPPGGQN